MLKITLAVGSAILAEVGNEKQDSKKIQVEKQDKKEPKEKRCKSQQMAKSKK